MRTPETLLSHGANQMRMPSHSTAQSSSASTLGCSSSSSSSSSVSSSSSHGSLKNSSGQTAVLPSFGPGQATLLVDDAFPPCYCSVARTHAASCYASPTTDTTHDADDTRNGLAASDCHDNDDHADDHFVMPIAYTKQVSFDKPYREKKRPETVRSFCKRFRTLGVREQTFLPTLVATSLLLIGLMGIACQALYHVYWRAVQAKMADSIAMNDKHGAMKAHDIRTTIITAMSSFLVVTGLLTFCAQSKTKRNILVLAAQFSAGIVIFLQTMSFSLGVYFTVLSDYPARRLGGAYWIVSEIQGVFPVIFLVSILFWLFPPPSRLIAVQTDHRHRTMHFILAITMVHSLLNIVLHAMGYQNYVQGKMGLVAELNLWSFLIPLSMAITLCLSALFSLLARRVERPTPKYVLHVLTLVSLVLSLVALVTRTIRAWHIAANRPIGDIPLARELSYLGPIYHSFITLAYISLGYYCSPCRQEAGDLPRRKENENMRNEEMMVVV